MAKVIPQISRTEYAIIGLVTGYLDNLEGKSENGMTEAEYKAHFKKYLRQYAKDLVRER